MDFETSDYFTYKKNKMHTENNPKGKKFSRFNFLLQLFIITFIIMFIIIVVAIMKYSSKMDIEYSKGDLSFNNADSSNSVSGYTSADFDDEQRKIDKRLALIQQEENAPSEAKIIKDGKQETDQVIAPEHVENSKKIDKIEKIKAFNAQSEQNEANNSKISAVLDEVKHMTGKAQVQKQPQYDENITITSKVLIGRFSSVEQASAMQSEIKSNDASLTPFVRKIGDIYSVQMGSYQDFHVAKSQAQKLKALGYEVWIYQQ